MFSQDSFLFQKPGPGWPAPASCARVLDIAMSNSSAPDSKLSRSSFELVISTVYNRRSIGLLDSDVKGHTATSPQRRGTFCPRSPSTGIDLIVSCHGQSTTTWSRHWPVVGGRQPVPGAAVAPRRRAAVLPRPRTRARPASPWATRCSCSRAPVLLGMDAYVRGFTPSPRSPPSTGGKDGEVAPTAPLSSVGQRPKAVSGSVQSTVAQTRAWGPKRPAPSPDEPAGVAHRFLEVRCDGPGPPSSPQSWRRWDILTLYHYNDCHLLR